jgi:hypothetical protein
VTRPLLVSALAALTIAGAVGAMPSWTLQRAMPDSLSDGRELGPELAANRSGGAVAVWDLETGPDCAQSPASLTCIHTVETASRTHSGDSWSSGAPIARPGVGARPRAAVDDAGDAALLWVHDIGTYRVVQATLRHGPGGEFPNPNDLSDAVLEVRSHHIALDDAGDAVAVWAQRPLDLFEVHAEVRRANFGVWGVATLLSNGAVSGGPSLGVTRAGEAFVVWIENRVVKAVRGDISAGTWAQPVALSNGAGEAGGEPVVALNDAGDAVAVWQWRERPNAQTIVQAAFRPSQGSWRPSRDVAVASTAFTHEPQAAIDAAGNTVALWLGGPGGTALQSAVGSRDSDAWSRPVAPAPGAAADPQLAVDPRGDVVALWMDAATKTTNAAVRAAAGGAWQPPIQVSPVDAFDPRLAMDDTGNAVALWGAPFGQKVHAETADLVGDWQPTLANKRRPIVRGRVRVGRTVVCDRGAWEGTLPIRYAYQWRRNGAALRGATQTKYRIRLRDGGVLLSCRVTATNPARTLSVTSRPIRVRR